MSTPNRDSHGRFVHGSGSGGAHVNEGAIEHAKERLKERSERVTSHKVSVGIHEAEGAQPKLGLDNKPGTETLGHVAAAHEFGIGVPDRSWLRTWFDQNRNRFAKEMVDAMRAAFRGDDGAIGRLGIAWQNELRQWIATSEGGLEALQPSTVAAKAGAGLPQPQTPLLATGQLVDAIKSMLDGGSP